jgi:prepilin-type N-terminal cleavage/methylation domain-containing protein/prepilin-type processing-associated H-X9-DG protein
MKRAFTLVELLVVIAIIALLVSLLMPAVASAMRQAKRIQCAANLRGILQGMHLYAQENGGAIPGGANTSGAFLYKGGYGNNNCPAVSQIWDWQAPIARSFRMPFDEQGGRERRIDRFRLLANDRRFFCPENDVLAAPYGAVDYSAGGRGLMCVNSYNIAAIFQYTRGGIVGQHACRSEYMVPAGYVPRLGRIGSASRKIYVADGARYSSCSVRPDMDLDYKGGFGGAYADVGAWSCWSNSWSRHHAPGNSGQGDVDGRIYAFRHGTRRQDEMRGAYLLNAGFFDGHVETLGDLAAANPEFWAPRGTALKADPIEMYPDVINTYITDGANPWIVP